MSFSTNPRTARERFKSRFLRCIAALTLLFVALTCVISWLAANVFSSFTLMLVGDVVALGLVYYLYLTWRDQPVKLCCPHCEAVILSNTPWVCGFCKQTNRNANQFPFVDKCGHCGDEAKTYQCHHCAKLIFLTEDEIKINYAYSLNAPTETTPAQEHAEKIKKLRADKELKEAKLSNAQVDAELVAMRNRIKLQKPKKKSARDVLEERMESEMEWEEAEAAIAAEIEEKHKNNPKLKKRMLMALRNKVTGGLPDR